jgi:hypothetical protein
MGMIHHSTRDAIAQNLIGGIDVSLLQHLKPNAIKDLLQDFKLIRPADIYAGSHGKSPSDPGRSKTDNHFAYGRFPAYGF